MELGEGHHRLGAGVEHALQVGGKQVPILDRIRHGLVEHEDADDLGAHQPQPPLDALAVLARARAPPAVDLVEAVAQLHPPRARGAFGSASLLGRCFSIRSRHRRHSSMISISSRNRASGLCRRPKSSRIPCTMLGVVLGPGQDVEDLLVRAIATEHQLCGAHRRRSRARIRIQEEQRDGAGSRRLEGPAGDHAQQLEQRPIHDGVEDRPAHGGGDLRIGDRRQRLDPSFFR